MKHTLYLASILFLASCTNQTDNFPIDTDNNYQITSRVVENGGDVSTSNPDLLTDWENETQVLLSNGYKENLPWSIGYSGAIPSDVAKDIKKQDGWTMLFHTFKGLNENQHQNYLCFYNELTGMFKVFYYSDIIVDSNSGFLWQFKTSGDIKTGLIPTADSFYSESMNSTKKCSEIFLSPLTDNAGKGVMSGWNVFQLELAYDNNINNTDFIITAINKEITNYSFDGFFDATTKGTIVQTNTAQKQKSNGIANLIGEKAKNYIGSIPTGGYAAIIKGGLNLITKTISGKGNDKIIQDVDLKTHGSIELNGTGEIIQSSQIQSLGGISFSNCTNEQGLGLWNLATTPQLTYERYSRFVMFDLAGEPIKYVDGLVLSPEIYTKNIEVVLNPAITKYITNKNIQVTWFYAGRQGTITSKYTDEEVELLYSSNNSGLSLYKSRGSGFTIPASGTAYSGYSNYYDWGPADSNTDNFIINITLELTYNYNGKMKSFISSRNYKAEVIEDYTFSKIPSNPSNHIVRDMQF